MSTSAPFLWLAKAEIIVFMVSFAATIVYGMLTGKINTRNLLYGTRRNGEKYFSPGRVQLIVVTFTVATQYLIAAGCAPPGKMPDLPPGSMELLGLSNAMYLGGKGLTAFRQTASAE